MFGESKQRFAMARAPWPAREARALPRKSVVCGQWSVVSGRRNQMSNPSVTVPIHRQDVDATNTTRPLRWSVWREVWENPPIYITPLAVAVGVLVGVMISTYSMPERRHRVLLMDPTKQTALL